MKSPVVILQWEEKPPTNPTYHYFVFRELLKPQLMLLMPFLLGWSPTSTSADSFPRREMLKARPFTARQRFVDCTTAGELRLQKGIFIQAPRGKPFG